MNSLALSLRQTLQFIKSNPLTILLVQLPLGLLILIQRATEPYLEGNPVWAVLTLLPLFSIGSSLCSALTLTLIGIPNPTSLSAVGLAWKKVLGRSQPLILSSLIISIFFGLGLAAFVIPGLYFMTLYLFVPLLVMTEPKQSISSYLYQSKTLVKRSTKTFIRTLIIVTFALVIEVPSTFLVEYLSNLIGGAVFIDLFFSMLLGAVVDCVIVFHFLSLRSKGNP